MKKISLTLAVLMLSACESAQHKVDTLYINGVIWTGIEGASDAQAMAIKDGAISFVGSQAGIEFQAANTVDLDGRFVMAGFVDNHVHLIEGGNALASVDLRDAASPEEFSQRIVDYAAGLPEGRWVTSGNWDHENWGGELPHKDWIDEGTGDRPVFVFRLDGHMALANSAALKLAGIDADTPTPPGGEIVRDENGEPTGVLKDTALEPVIAVMPAPGDDELVEHFERAQAHALSVGLTQVHAVSAGPSDMAFVKALLLAQERGVMKLRVRAYPPLERWEEAKENFAGPRDRDAKLQFGGLKHLVDGSLGSTTAWFYAPYSDQPETSGFPLIEMADLKSFMAAADADGQKLAIHAIGDRAIDELIAAFEEIAGDEIKGRRYRIEHFQHPNLMAINKAAESGIIASMQPYHAIDDGRWAEARIGPQRIATTYAFRTILDAGGILTFGSDWPVAPLAPLAGVDAAVNRALIDGSAPGGWQPHEQISVAEALSAYTRANAYAAFEDDIAGTLAAGKRADFVILSADPRTAASEAIRDISVLQTVIAGEAVFTAK